MLQIKWSLVRSQLVSLEYFIDVKSFQLYRGPGVDSASDRNDHQEYFLWGKGGRCVRLTTLPPSCAVVMKSGSLNFLEPSGPFQACNRTAVLPVFILNVLQRKRQQLTGNLTIPLTCFVAYVKRYPNAVMSEYKDWRILAQGRDSWQAVLNTVLTLHVS